MTTSEVISQELLALPGVAGAEIDLTGGQPSGVKVRLDPGVDAASVGAEVSRILAAHGIRSRVGGPAGPERAPQPPAGPPPPPGAPGTVISLSGGEAPAPTARPGPAAAPAVADPEPARPMTVVTGMSLAGVAVEETRDAVVVSATAGDGREVSRRARWSEGGLNEALTAAVASLAGEDVTPELIGVREADVGETTVITVILQRRDGSRLAGAAVVEAGVPFALARAVWAALTTDRG